MCVFGTLIRDNAKVCCCKKVFTDGKLLDECCWVVGGTVTEWQMVASLVCTDRYVAYSLKDQAVLYLVQPEGRALGQTEAWTTPYRIPSKLQSKLYGSDFQLLSSSSNLLRSSMEVSEQPRGRSEEIVALLSRPRQIYSVPPGLLLPTCLTVLVVGTQLKLRRNTNLLQVDKKKPPKRVQRKECGCLNTFGSYRYIENIYQEILLERSSQAVSCRCTCTSLRHVAGPAHTTPLNLIGAGVPNASVRYLRE
jgi:hypothetical protein